MRQAGGNGLRLGWIKPCTRLTNTSFQPGKISVKWFEGRQMIVSANCLDRHILTRADQTAIIRETDDPKTPSKPGIDGTLLEQTCRLANVLQAHGVTKGDLAVL